VGLIRRVGHRVLQTLAARVAQNHLFEKPGERSAQAQLDPPLARAGSVAELRRKEGPVVFHHWATWCAPCEEELPLVQKLAEDLGERAPVVGVSWDRFQDDGPLEQTVKRVDGMARTLGIRWISLVLTDGPEETFAALGLDLQTVPQTLLVGADGSVLHHVKGPLDDEALTAIKGLL